MRIIEEYTETSNKELEISSVEYLSGYSLKLFFNDGAIKIVDLEAFLENPLHPSIRKYLDENNFKNYKIIDGNLNWNDYDLIFPLEDLYEGKL